MKAVVLYKTGKPEVLSISEVPVPKVKAGWILVKIKVFGLNRSELMMRQFEGDAPYIRLPRIIGIECAGEIANPSDSGLQAGQKVVALMGGMGRTFDGSYAEYALVPIKHVFTIDTDLSWEEIGAIPETYFTAYGSLFDCLQITPGDTLFIRGGTSAAGIAAIQLAKNAGAIVLASTRKNNKQDFLRSQGADQVLIDNGTLAEQLLKRYPQGINKVLELIGASTLLESLKLTARHGIVCCSGQLGKKASLDGFDPIKDIPNGIYLSGFFSNYPTQQTIDAIFNLIKTNNLHPLIAKVFPLSEIAQAHSMAERDEANGKIVVRVAE
ncbi:MAG: zinc-binding alcohol dehydrogenase family protein [Tannerellaceae bacterium]|nr:zinc-binding alcohol dehydrogenase family protein [Tannerellaceae bacterium]